MTHSVKLMGGKWCVVINDPWMGGEHADRVLWHERTVASFINGRTRVNGIELGMPKAAQVASYLNGGPLTKFVADWLING